MLMASILMFFIAILPLLLGTMTYRAFGNSQLSIAILLFMVFVGIWQLDVTFLFMGGLAEIEHLEFLFRLFRMGQMLLTPTFLYIFYVFSKSSNTELEVIKKPYIFIAYGWGIITYVVNWTDLGISHLEMNDYHLLIPIYGIGNITYYIHLFLSCIIVYLAFREIKLREHDIALKSFMKKFIYYAVLLLTMGVLNFIEKVLLLAGTFSIVVFSTLISLALIKYNFDTITKLNKLVSTTSKPAYANSLISNLIHELRNPLAAMKGYSELLPLRQELNKDGEIIHQQLNLASEHMQQIVEGFVDFVKSGQIKLERYCINTLVKEAVSLSKSKADEKNVDIKVKTERASLETYMDTVKMRQVIINMLSNSIDAFSEDKQNKFVEIFVTKNNNDEVLIDIKDTGNGMTENTKNKLFVPSKSDKQHGFGLGLTISKNILMAHGGNIELVSSDSTGTHFAITVPTLNANQGWSTESKDAIERLNTLYER